MIPLIFAVSLSLSSTNDYLFSTPFSTNIVGEGIGEGLDYRVPRTEDKMFLWEAYEERATLLEWLSGSAVTTRTPIARGPYTGYETNAVPHSYAFRDLLLYHYYPPIRGAFGVFTNENNLSAISFDLSRTIDSMTFVTNASLYSEPSRAIPFVFQRKSPDADRNFLRSFDTNLFSLATLAMTAAPYTNAYHDLIRNDALTWYRDCRGRDGEKDTSLSTVRYEDWPTSYDPRAGVDYRTNTTSRSSTTNSTKYVQMAAQKSVNITCRKAGFSYADDGNIVGGDDGIWLTVSEGTEKPVTTCSVTFSCPLGKAEPIEAKCFAVVLVSARGYSQEAQKPSTNLYTKSVSLVCPVSCGSFYKTHEGLYAVDVSVDIDGISDQALSLIGESWPYPYQVSGWIESPSRPTVTTQHYTGLIQGQMNTAGANAMVMIWNIVGFTRFRFNAMAKENQ